MKIKYLFLACAAFAAVACSEKEEAPQNNPQAQSGADKGYIALNLKSADDVTRAEGGNILLLRCCGQRIQYQR